MGLYVTSDNLESPSCHAKMDARKVIREHDSDQGNRSNRDCRFIPSFDVKTLVPSPFLHQIIIHCIDNL